MSSGPSLLSLTAFWSHELAVLVELVVLALTVLFELVLVLMPPTVVLAVLPTVTLLAASALAHVLSLKLRSCRNGDRTATNCEGGLILRVEKACRAQSIHIRLLRASKADRSLSQSRR